MKKFSTRFMAFAVAFMMIFTMTNLSGITVEAAKSNVTVTYSGKKVKKPSVTSIKASIDGNKASKKATIYLSGKKKVKVNMAVSIKVKGKSTQKLKNANKVTYTSSDKSVASVSTKGVITAKKAGTVTIKVTSKANKKKSYKIKVTVVEGVTSMKLKTSEKLTLYNGSSKSFTPVISVRERSKVKKTIVASSSNKKVATVNVSIRGVVTINAVGAGTAEVKVGPKHGSGKAKTIKVTVLPVYKYTRVDFTNPNSNSITMKGSVKVVASANNTLVEDVKEVLKAIGGTYTIKVGTKTLNVVNGVADKELDSLLTSKSQADITITSSKKISEFIAMAGNVKSLSKDINVSVMIGIYNDSATVRLDTVIKKDGTMDITVLGKTYRAFVAKGNVYLVGNHAADGQILVSLMGNEIVKGFTPVEFY